MSDRVYSYEKNKYYKKYKVKRDKIKEKYSDILVGNYSPPGPPPKAPINYSKEERDRYKQYLKEMADLLFKPNGLYQKFVWDTIGEHEQLIRDRKTRRKLNDSKYI